MYPICSVRISGGVSLLGSSTGVRGINSTSFEISNNTRYPVLSHTTEMNFSRLVLADRATNMHTAIGLGRRSPNSLLQSHVVVLPR